MSDVRKYVLVNEHNTEGDYEYTSFQEARKAGRKYGEAVILRHYTRDEDGDLRYEDSELVWTPNGANARPERND